MSYAKAYFNVDKEGSPYQSFLIRVPVISDGQVPELPNLVQLSGQIGKVHTELIGILVNTQPVTYEYIGDLYNAQVEKDLSCKWDSKWKLL